MHAPAWKQANNRGGPLPWSCSLAGLERSSGANGPLCMSNLSSWSRTGRAGRPGQPERWPDGPGRDREAGSDLDRLPERRLSPSVSIRRSSRGDSASRESRPRRGPIPLNDARSRSANRASRAIRALTRRELDGRFGTTAQSRWFSGRIGILAVLSNVARHPPTGASQCPICHRRSIPVSTRFRALWTWSLMPPGAARRMRRTAATKVLSNTGVFLSRVVYGATYTISYGVVFPVALVAGSIPRNNAAVRGLIEGGAGGEPPGRCDPRPLSVSAGSALNAEAPVAVGCHSIIPRECNAVVAEDGASDDGERAATMDRAFPVCPRVLIA